MDEKKMLFSGIQPSGIPTIGNYIGALRNFPLMQDSYNCVYSIVDLHSVTVVQDPAVLRANTYNLLALYLACGLDPEKCIIFVQSHVSAHTELTWILNTISYPGELSRMTQFKDKSQKHADNVNMALMDYPVLMAADILLYSTEMVPIGNDQKQHLELARDLAIRFNNRYGETFKVPEGFIPKFGARIKSLQEPTIKMNKSDSNPNAYISMFDDDATIIRKFKRAVTDSGSGIVYSEADKPGISNLLTIYSAFSNKTIAEAEKEFEGKGYGDFKLAVGETVASGLRPIRKEKDRLLGDKEYLNGVLKNGAERASRIADRMVAKVYKKLGFIQRIR